VSDARAIEIEGEVSAEKRAVAGGANEVASVTVVRARP